jgi:antitoxin VapB
VAALTHETKIQTIRPAQQRQQERTRRLTRFLENEAWPQIPESQRGRPITKEECEAIFGYGPDGV